MSIEIHSLMIASVTGAIRLLAGPDGTVLYMAETRAATRDQPPLYDFETVLTPLSVGAGSKASTATATIAQPLPPPPSWDLSLSADGSLNVAYTIFGGGWNRCELGVVKNGQVANTYSYALGDCGAPRLVRNTSTTGTAKALTSAILDSQHLGLLLPQPASNGGDVSVEFLALVDATSGVVFGDLSADIPTAVTLVYKTANRTGPLSPGEGFPGSLSLARYDLSEQAVSSVQPLLDGAPFYELDAAFRADTYCLLASTEDGAPLLAAFDSAGRLLGTPYLPFGSWNTADRWISSPTITADPQYHLQDLLGFKVAFIEHEGDTPMAVHLSTVPVSPKTGIAPATAAAG